VAAFRARVLDAMPKDATLIVFNNAGINSTGKMAYDAGEDPAAFERLWDKCFNVDFFGVVNFTREFLPAMRARKAAHLVNTASVNALCVGLAASAAASATQRTDDPPSYSCVGRASRGGARED